MHNYYFLYNNYFEDKGTGFAEFGHLLTYNPGDTDAEIKLTYYYEDRDPAFLNLTAFAGTTTESNYESWGLAKPQRFAYKVESPVPLACQATIGWNNVLNDYRSPDLVDPKHRETVISYTAITGLSTDWYHPDCIVIDMPKKIWVKESEWLIVLNPGNEKADLSVEMAFDNKEKTSYEFVLEPVRFKFLYMDDIAVRNVHYGLHVKSDKGIAAQWLRTVNWYDKKELMAYWSVPLVPAPLR